MLFLQRGLFALMIAGGTVLVAGCGADNATNVSAGTTQANAPKDSMEAFKQQSGMAPQGAPAPGAPRGSAPKK